MTTSTMMNPHRDAGSAPWQWRLAPRTARRLAAQPRARWLAVEQGRVWLTRSRRELESGDDLWLQEGERIALPAGSDWVAEGWPEARIVVLEAAPPV